jgi:hypothetical protein
MPMRTPSRCRARLSAERDRLIVPSACSPTSGATRINALRLATSSCQFMTGSPKVSTRRSCKMPRCCSMSWYDANFGEIAVRRWKRDLDQTSPTPLWVRNVPNCLGYRPPGVPPTAWAKLCQFRNSRESRILARNVNHFTLGQPRPMHRLDRNTVASNKNLGGLDGIRSSMDDSGRRSKYPPAEPGALGVEPLKAAIGVAGAPPICGPPEGGSSVPGPVCAYCSFEYVSSPFADSTRWLRLSHALTVVRR